MTVVPGLRYRRSCSRNCSTGILEPTSHGVMMIARIYIAGPYSTGDMAVNVRTAYEVANRLADLGFAPFVPHATHFWHMLFPRPYEFWLDLDNQFLPCCEGLLRLPGISSGADKEV